MTTTKAMSTSRAKRHMWWASVLALTTKPVIGGQAVIEGVMMRSPKSFAIAVRTPDGGITVREEAWLSFSERLPFLKWPLLRGATMLVESMYNGLLALNFSAATAFPDDAAAKTELQKTETAKQQGGFAMMLPLVVSLAFAFALFKGVPHFTAWGLGELLANTDATGTKTTALPMTSPLFHLVDGGVKLCLFIGYILLISRMNEVKRLFMYHGAEHKSVHVWEANEPLDVAHATPKTTAHPRCGTSLLLLVIATSMLVFAAVLPFVPVVSDHTALQALLLLVIKLPLLLPIAGLAYELQRLAAKYPTNPIVRMFIAPGMLMQRLTTREPGPAELEVALAALQKTVWRERQDAQPRSTAATVESFGGFSDVTTRLAA
jgi:uncharacterized protein YqhQ